MAVFTELSKNNVNYVEVELSNEAITLESGAMYYMQGHIEVETKVPSIGGMLKAGLTGENIIRPVYSGTGKIMLEPSFNDYHVLNLNNETFILDQGSYVASDASVEVSAFRNKFMTGLRSGEGMFQTKVSGTGQVVVQAQGPIQLIELNNDKLSVDGTFAVARAESLSYSVQKVTKSLLGAAASGEGFVNVFEGSGKVFLAPVPTYANMLARVVSPYSYSASN